MATPSKVKLPPQFQAVEDLLLWRDIPKSAGVLAIFTVVYFLLEISSTPLLTWISNLGVVAILGTAIWGAVGRAMNITGPSDHLPSLVRTGIDEAGARAIAEKARQHVNLALAKVGLLLGGTDLTMSIKALAVLWVVGWVGRIISPVGLLFLVIVLLFSLPKLYEMRKDDVDRVAGMAVQNAGKHYEVARAKVNEAVARLTPKKAPRPEMAKDE